MVSFNFDFVLDDAPSGSAGGKIVRDEEVINGLESVGHLAGKVCSIWGTAELDAFLNHLIMDARDGARSGLPVEAAADVLFLIRLNKDLRAIALAQSLGINFFEAFGMVDEGDQSRLRRDIYDDPGVSRDTVRLGRTSTPSGGAGAQPLPAGQVSGLIDLLLMLARNPLVIGVIVVVLGAKLLWPFLKNLQ